MKYTLTSNEIDSALKSDVTINDFIKLLLFAKKRCTNNII